MSDESTRSAHGNPPHQGPSDGVPAWWSELWRTDLPEDPRAGRLTHRTGGAPAQRRERPAQVQRSAARPAQRPAARRRALMQRLGNALLLVAVVVTALLVTWIGMGDPTPRGVVVVALVFGVPMVLTLAAVSVITRRHGR